MWPLGSSPGSGPVLGVSRPWGPALPSPGAHTACLPAALGQDCGLCGSELGSLTVLLKIPSNALVCLKGKAPESVSRGFVRHCWPLPFPVGTQLLVLPFAGLGARRWALLSPGLSASRPAGLQQEEAASEVLPLGCLSQSKHVEPWDLSGALGALGHEQKILHLIHQP